MRKILCYNMSILIVSVFFISISISITYLHKDTKNYECKTNVKNSKYKKLHMPKLEATLKNSNCIKCVKVQKKIRLY